MFRVVFYYNNCTFCLRPSPNKARIEENTLNLFQLGDFTLNSGIKSKWKLECDALTDDDINTLAQMICQLISHRFSSVEGVPTGGLRLAKALSPFASISGPHLIVDDVLTTAKSIKDMTDKFKGTGKKPEDVIGAVIFARGQCPYWVKPLFQMPEVFWTKPRHR